MKNITELLQQLNTMQSDHIKTLEQRIEVINKHKQHLNETITSQAEQLQNELNKNKFINKTNKELVNKIKIQEDTIKMYIDSKKE